MAKSSIKKLKKLGRAELLELLVKQGEQLDKTKAELEAAQERAAYQERIARLAEKAVSRLSGILEAAQLAQDQYIDALTKLKAQMGLTVSNEAEDQESQEKEDPLLAAIPEIIAEAKGQSAQVEQTKEASPSAVVAPVAAAAPVAAVAAVAAVEQADGVAEIADMSEFDSTDNLIPDEMFESLADVLEGLTIEPGSEFDFTADDATPINDPVAYAGAASGYEYMMPMASSVPQTNGMAESVFSGTTGSMSPVSAAVPIDGMGTNGYVSGSSYANGVDGVFVTRREEGVYGQR